MKLSELANGAKTTPPTQGTPSVKLSDLVKAAPKANDLSFLPGAPLAENVSNVALNLGQRVFNTVRPGITDTIMFPDIKRPEGQLSIFANFDRPAAGVRNAYRSYKDPNFKYGITPLDYFAKGFVRPDTVEPFSSSFQQPIPSSTSPVEYTYNDALKNIVRGIAGGVTDVATDPLNIFGLLGGKAPIKNAAKETAAAPVSLSELATKMSGAEDLRYQKELERIAPLGNQVVPDVASAVPTTNVPKPKGSIDLIPLHPAEEGRAALKALEERRLLSSPPKPAPVDIPLQFNNPNDTKLLDYLGQYVSPKVVAGLSGEERLNLANGPVQNLQSLALKYKENVLPPKQFSSVDDSVEIPVFKNTEEAVSFGKENKGNPQVLSQLSKLREESLAKSKELRSLEEPSAAQMQQGMDEAVRGQFYREALKGASGEIQDVGKSVKRLTAESKPVNTQNILFKKSLRSRRGSVDSGIGDVGDIGDNLGAKASLLKQIAEFKRDAQVKGKPFEQYLKEDLALSAQDIEQVKALDTASVPTKMNLVIPDDVKPKPSAQEMIAGTPAKNLSAQELIGKTEPLPEKIGNIQTKKFPNEADALVKAAEENPVLKKKTLVSRKNRTEVVMDDAVKDVLSRLTALSPAQQAAIGDVPGLELQRVAKKLQETGIDYGPVLDDVTEHALRYQTVGATGARIIQARKVPLQIDEILDFAKNKLKTEKDPAKVKKLTDTITILEPITKNPRKADIWDMLLEYSAANLLSSPDTMARNFLGNTMLAGQKIANRFTQGALSRTADVINYPIKKLSGGKLEIPVRNKSLVREAAVEVVSGLRNTSTAAKRAWKYIVNEADYDVIRSYKKDIERIQAKVDAKKISPEAGKKIEDEINENIRLSLENAGKSKIEDITPVKGAIPDIPMGLIFRDKKGTITKQIGIKDKSGDLVKIPFGSAFRVVFRPLKAGDEYFGLISEEGTKDALRFRKSIEEKIPFDKVELTDADVEEAFSDRLYYTLLKDLPEVAEVFRKTIQQKAKPLGFIFRFIKTSVNLFNVVIDHSPLGLATNVWPKSQAAGGLDLKEMAKVVNGTLGAVILYNQLRKNDIEIRGGAKSKAQADVWIKEKFPENAVKFPNGRVFTFNNNAPASYLFAVTAAYDSYVRDVEKGAPPGDATMDALHRGLTGVLKESYLDGPEQLANLLQNWGNGEQLAKYFNRTVASQVVPFSGLSRKVTRVTDRVVREPSGLKETIKANIPIMSRGIKPALAWDGAVSIREKEWAIQPIRGYTYTDKKLDRYLSKLEVYPAPPSKTVRGIPLREEDRRAMVQRFGPTLRSAMDAIVHTKGFAQLPETEQAKVLEKIVSTTHKVGYKLALLQAIRKVKQYPDGQKALKYYYYEGRSNVKPADVSD